MTETQSDELLRAACDFQGLSHDARDKCREEYRRKESNEQNILRIIIDGLVALLARKVSDPIPRTDEGISYQVAVTAAYIRSHYVINDLIMNGDIVEALTVLRRQIESLARLNEIDAKPLAKLLGRTPNVKNILGRHSGPLYGYLSEIAHSASPQVATLLVVVSEGERVGPSLTPRWSEHLGAAFEVQWYFALYFLIWTIERLQAWYPGHHNSEEKGLIREALVLAVQIGVLRYPQDEGPAKDLT